MLLFAHEEETVIGTNGGFAIAFDGGVGYGGGVALGCVDAYLLDEAAAQ